MDIDEVDIVLGHHWIESVGVINVNVKKKFLKLWFNKKKITLQDMSLSKKEEPIETIKVVIVEFEVEFEAEPTERHEEKPQDKQNKEAKKIIE